MDSSTLESEIANLENRSKSLEHWLSPLTILVAAGLVVEVFMIVNTFLSPYPEHSGTKLIADLVGPVLVAIGVSGEAVIHVKALNVNTELQSTNRKATGLLNKAVAEANERAAQSNERAAQASERAANAAHAVTLLQTTKLRDDAFGKP